MNWLYYPLFFYVTSVVWVIAFFLLFFKYRRQEQIAFSLSIFGFIVILFFTVILWLKLNRPPFRTLGETRLWYSLFLPFIGILLFLKWRFRWFLQYSLALAIVFLTINFLKPETHEKTLMPALQSVWFIPHVIVYIFAYALLAASSIIAIKGLYLDYNKKLDKTMLNIADTITNYGFAFLTLGLLFGALWAKEAWGDYWTWDPKETWAFITWMGYLIYLHVRNYQPQFVKTALWILASAFIIMLICWFGVNYLPTAQNSVHTYTQ